MKKEEKFFWGYIIGCIASIFLMVMIVSMVQLNVPRIITSTIFYSFIFLTVILLILALITYFKNPNMFKERIINRSKESNHEEKLQELQKIREKNLEKSQIKCPHCKSKNIQFMSNKKKAFSVGKAAAGAALTGGVGTLAGFAGKKGSNQWFCKNCNQVFETKK